MNLKSIVCAALAASVAACMARVDDVAAGDGTEPAPRTIGEPSPRVPLTPGPTAPQKGSYVRQSRAMYQIVGNPHNPFWRAVAECDEGDTIITGGCMIDTLDNVKHPNTRLTVSIPAGRDYDQTPQANYWSCEGATDINDVIGAEGASSLKARVVCQRH